MGYRLHAPTAEMNDFDIIVPIASGGLSGDSAVSSVDNIGGVTEHKYNRQQGLAQLNSQQKVDFQSLPNLNISAGNVSLNGPRTIVAGQTYQYQITNYDTETVYNISVSDGSVSRNESVISLTPSNSGTLNLTVNGRTVNITVNNPAPVVVGVSTPTVTTSVLGGSGGQVNVRLMTNPFSNSSGASSHLNTDWQLATDVNFSNIVLNLQASTSLTSTDVVAVENTSYYARARHRDNLGNVSNWGVSNQFTTPDTTPEAPSVTIATPTVSSTGYYLSSNQLVINFNVSNFQNSSGSSSFSQSDIVLTRNGGAYGSTLGGSFSGGTLSFTVPNDSASYSVSVSYRDNLGNTSAAGSGSINTSYISPNPTTPPNQPTVQGSATFLSSSGGVDTIRLDIWISSAFSSNEPSAVHTTSRFKIRVQNGNTFLDTTASGAQLNSYYIELNTTEANLVFEFEAAVQDQWGNNSLWSYTSVNYSRPAG